MKTKLLLTTIILTQTACASLKYPNWEYVRIETEVPKDCIYKVQEACNKEANQCFDWHKKRATKYDANVVVIQKEIQGESYATSFWSGRLKGGTGISTIAEYYNCTGGKTSDLSKL